MIRWVCIYQNYILNELEKTKYLEKIAKLPNVYEVNDDGDIVDDEEVEEITEEVKLPIKYKESFIKRFFNKIKSFFFSKVA